MNQSVYNSLQSVTKNTDADEIVTGLVFSRLFWKCWLLSMCYWRCQLLRWCCVADGWICESWTVVERYWVLCWLGTEAEGRRLTAWAVVQPLQEASELWLRWSTEAHGTVRRVATWARRCDVTVMTISRIMKTSPWQSAPVMPVTLQSARLIISAVLMFLEDVQKTLNSGCSNLTLWEQCKTSSYCPPPPPPPRLGLSQSSIFHCCTTPSHLAPYGNKNSGREKALEPPVELLKNGNWRLVILTCFEGLETVATLNFWPPESVLWWRA